MPEHLAVILRQEALPTSPPVPEETHVGVSWRFRVDEGRVC